MSRREAVVIVVVVELPAVVVEFPRRMPAKPPPTMRSRTPSPFISPVVTESFIHDPYVTAAWKVPFPFPKLTAILPFSHELIRSNFPSPFKSAAAIHKGELGV